MSSDLDKLMGKLQKPKVEETPLETEEVEEEIDDQDDDEDDQEDEIPTPAQKIKETPKKADLKVKTPAQVEDPENTINAELGLLQNNAIFRRELLLILKELVDVQKVNAEILIKISKELRK